MKPPKPPLGNINNMEKPSTQESTVSPASRANEQTPEEELYPRLSINSSATTNKTMPSTPQRNLVHSTLPQNQCAQHSAGQYASTPTIEQTTGNQTPTTGMDGDTPHRDEGTQMPSQEIHMITINQGTQIPSQQWEQTITAEDHETEQSITNRLETISQNPSIRSGAHQGALIRQPTQPPALDTDIIDTIGSRQKTYIHSKPVIIQKDHAPTQMVDMRTKRDDTRTHLVHINKEDQSPEATTPDKEHIPETPRAHPNNQHRGQKGETPHKKHHPRHYNITNNNNWFLERQFEQLCGGNYCPE